MADIAGCKVRTIGNGYSRDQSVAKVGRTPDSLTAGGNASGGRGSAFIERQNLISDSDFNHSRQSVFELLPLPAGGESFDSRS